jgi:hypothetical protein
VSGDDDLSSEIFEIRPWQDFRINYPSGIRYYFTHQIRFEERFSYFDSDSLSRSFEVRLRYKLGLVWDIHYLNERDNIYAKGFVEFFYPLTDEVDEFYRNRTRSGLGIGYDVKEKYRLEFMMNLQQSRFTVSEYAYQLKFHYWWKRRLKDPMEEE